MSGRRPDVPGVDEVRAFCQRVRSAGSPNARARPALVGEYRRIAVELGVRPEEVATGADLGRAATRLLRAAASSAPGSARARGGF